MKKTASREPMHTNAELKRYLGVLHEEHMSGLKAMGEQFIEVNRKLDAHTKILDSHTKTLELHTKILDSHTERLDSHTEMIGGLAMRMTSMELKMADMQKKLAETERNILILKDDIGFIKSGMRRKVDQEEFDALIRRVSMLEKRVLK